MYFSKWLGLLLVSCCFIPYSYANEIYGNITLESKRRLHNGDTELAIIFYRPAIETKVDADTAKKVDINDDTVIDATPETPELLDEPVEMRMEMKAFNPTVAVVQTGSTVNFPNADRVIHNAFSTSKKNKFDLGFYSQGESRTQQFNEAGLVKVYCNVHKNMYGYVMVLDTPYFTKANPDGTFSLKNLPEGLGKIFVWHPRGKTTSSIVEVTSKPVPFNTTISLTKRSIPKHKNKFGKSYRRNKDY